MPLFRLETNVSRSKITPEFLKETTAVMSKTLGRGQEFCVAEVIPDLPMCWGGTDAPGGNAIFMAIGLMGEEENKRHAAALFKHINKHLGIPEDRRFLFRKDIVPEEDIYHVTRYPRGRHLGCDKIPWWKTSNTRQDTMVEDIYHVTRYPRGRHLGRDKIFSQETEYTLDGQANSDMDKVVVDEASDFRRCLFITNITNISNIVKEVFI
uniref:L-dopachrome isomerase n=1 Tax=Timema cristinae TaxID=61476 RepID=A0A7R9GZZ7_TIMCR|nr:unnamed protein product [Timema cristinae]